MLKKLWFQLHWLLGISAGLILALMGFTGALLSFEPEILRVLNPGLMSVTVQHDVSMLSPPDLLQRISVAEPERRVGTLSVSAIPGRAARVGFLPATAPAPASAAPGRVRMEVFFVDPYSGSLLAAEDALRGHDFLHLMEDLHRRLAAGDTGKALTGASTLILLVLTGSGLYLRWPRRWRDPGAWFAVRWRQRGVPFLRSLHEVVGTWLLIPYLLVALTGLFWSYDWYRSGVFAITGASPPVRQALRGNDTPAGPMPELQTLWSAFLRETSARGYQSASFNLPGDNAPVTINYLDADPAHERASNALVLDPASGAVVNHTRYEDKNFGGRIASSMFALHKGSFFGVGGTLLNGFASLAMPLFAITGWMLYLKRRKLARSKQVAARGPASVSTDPKRA